MDTKRLIPMMLISFAVIFGWSLFVNRLYDKHPEWRRPGQSAATTQPTDAPADPAPATTPAVTTTQGTGATTAATPAAPEPVAAAVSAATQPTVATIGAEEAFAMAVRIASAGAALDLVTLKDFPAPDRQGEYTFQQPLEGPSRVSAMATRSITLNGREYPLVGVDWELEQQDARSATFRIDVGQVRVRKQFEVNDRSSPDQGLELIVRHVVENTSDEPIKVRLDTTGPVTPPRENLSGPDLQVIAGHDDGYQRATITHQLIEEYDTKAPERNLTVGEENAPLLWAGTASVYFTAILRPEPIDPGSASPKYVSRIAAIAMNPEAPPVQRRVFLTMQTEELELAPAGAAKPLTLSSAVYLGPRWRKLLAQPHYDQFPRDYDQSLVLTSGPCGFCTFIKLINGLVWLLGVFHFLLRDWGLAIIALVILVRLLLHPITKRSQVSMMKMGKLGPEMERLKKKYGDNKDELNKQMMGLYKEQGVGVYLGCLPMFLQMPIWIALWSSLNTTFELRQAPFLWGFTWIDDLARPDRLIEFGRIIHLPFGMTLSAFNLLPMLLAVVFYLQQEFTPKPPATTPEQKTQQKMMKWMSLLFPIFLYNGPSGLNLYILTSTTIGIIESKRIRDHIRQKEEDEKAGKILIEAPRGMKKRRDEDDDNSGSGARRLQGPRAPKTGMAGWLQKIQAKAEEMRQAAERGRK